MDALVVLPEQPKHHSQLIFADVIDEPVCQLYQVIDMDRINCLVGSQSLEEAEVVIEYLLEKVSG
jgi:hypothetical protein